ncbi:MAG: aldo/keto reductase [Ignavibacteria bacterium]|nr:aldo/keto reductase [Ignavibacteria bacterium]
MKFSNIGFGCYRISNKIEEHYQALYKALIDGINLIDTSANYYDGGSELLAGRVINELISESKIKREDIIIVTKGGYIQGQNLRLAKKLKSEDKPFGEVVEIQNGLWHCISPDFLEDQINRQLHRLDTEYIDVYLLHNPEYYLDWAKENDIQIEIAREVYYERIRKAFVYLETKVDEGKIKSYGVSSNTFISYSNQYNFTSLERVLDTANSIKADNHFKVIQLPFNLVEAGAIKAKNQISNTETVLDLADRTGMIVLVNRPLNAITSKGLVRLSEFSAEPFLEKDFIKQMKLVSLMEDDLLTEKITEEDLSEEELKNLKEYLTFGRIVEENWKFFGSIEHYNDIITQLFAPKIDFLIKFFDEKIRDENVKDFFGRYIKECYKLLNFVSNYYKMRAEKRSKFLNSIIDKNLDEKFHSLTLSEKAVLLLNSVKGVNCVLLGMRKEKYVDDALKVLNKNDIANAEEIIRFVSEEIQNAET